MGIVYLCRDQRDQELKRVAIKVLPLRFCREEAMRKTVQDNFALVSRLDHPNVVKLESLETDPEGRFCLVMEYLEGVDLHQWRKYTVQDSGWPLASEYVLPVLRQVAAGLDHIHANKVIHRDVKPASILVRSDRVVKILDFGIAAPVRTPADWVPLESWGARPYMAPEQRKGAFQNGRTDQYALAVTVFELFSGSLPAMRQTTKVTHIGSGYDDPPWRQMPAADFAKSTGLDAEGCAALLRALDPDIEKRYPSCGEFIESLAPAIERASSRSAQTCAQGMVFRSDAKAKAYVERQLDLAVHNLAGDAYAFHVRPQRRFLGRPAAKMDVGHLEWKIYRKADADHPGGDRANEDGEFEYWLLRMTSDRRFFVFIHGNTSAGPMTINKEFEHGSLLAADQVAESGPHALAVYVAHVLTSLRGNTYFYS